MKNLAAIKEICSAITIFESKFEKINRLTLNEAIIVQILSEEQVTASAISKITGLSPSNTSKILSKLETKWLIERVVGIKDKRHMIFSLTDEGKHIFNRLNQNVVEMPQLLEKFVEFTKETSNSI